MDHPCFFCGGAAHPATGHAYSETALACRRCTLEAFSFVQGHTNKSTGKKSRNGVVRPQTALSFYEAAVLWKDRTERGGSRAGSVRLPQVVRFSPTTRYKRNMIVNGKTVVIVNGKSTRILGRRFNEALRRSASEPVILDTEGRRIIPSKGLAWSAVAAQVRNGKSVQAKAA